MRPWKSHHDQFWKCWYLLPLILRKESWMEELLSTRQFKISIWRNSSHTLPTGKIKAYNIPNIAESDLYWQVDGIFSARGCHRCSGNSDHAWTPHWLGIQPDSWQKWSRCNGRTGHSSAHVSRMPVHKVKTRLASVGNLIWDQVPKTCCKLIPSWEMLKQRSCEFGPWKSDLQWVTKKGEDMRTGCSGKER